MHATMEPPSPTQHAEDLRDRTLHRALAEHRGTGEVIEQLSDAAGQGLPLRRTSNAVLAVFNALARRMQVDVKAPVQVPGDHGTNNLPAIARASGLRLRQVTLPPHWWKSDCGDFIGWNAENQPVALLRGNSGYEVFDPATETTQPVTDTLAAEIVPDAAILFRPLPDDVRGVFGLARFASAGLARESFRVALMSGGASLLAMFSALATGVLVDHVIPQSDRTLALHLLLAMIVTSVGQVLIQLASGIGTLRIQTLMTARTQTAVWDRLLRLPVSFIRKYSTGDLSHRAMMVTTISSEITGSVLRSLITGAMAMLILGLMVFCSPQLAFVAAVIGLLWCATTAPLAFAIRRHAVQKELLSGRLFGFVVQMLNGIARVRVSASEQRVFNEWGRRYSRTVDLSNRIRALENASRLLNLVLSPLSTIVLFSFAAGMLNTSTNGDSVMSAGVFLAFYSSFGMFLRGCTSAGEAVVDVADSFAKFRTVAPLLEEPPESAQAKQARPINGHVQFRNVSFRYGDGPLVLNDVNLEIKPGQFVAIVGASGSGKSTLMRLLLQFETPQTGSILLDGYDLTQLDMSSVRQQLGVVLQSNHLAAGSIFDNITMGCAATEEQVMNAARDAGFAEDIEKMPMGIHTMVSENGSNLSGGQRQRLMIARALIRNPRLLIFDEATSALDNRTQEIVSRSIARRGVTRIVIAHRLSTIRDADEIYVVDAGRIIQQGRFEDLKTSSGLLQDLTQLHLS